MSHQSFEKYLRYRKNSEEINQPRFLFNRNKSESVILHDYFNKEKRKGFMSNSFLDVNRGLQKLTRGNLLEKKHILFETSGKKIFYKNID